MSATTPDGSALLTRYGRPASSVFDLLGHGEVDLTAAVGWALSNSPKLMSGLLEALQLEGPAESVTVMLKLRAPTKPAGPTSSSPARTGQW